MEWFEESLNVSQLSLSAPRKLWAPLYRAVALATIIGMVFGGLLLTQPQMATAQSTAVVTDSLNLRAEPNTNSGIITIMPRGASVSIDGDAQNGFYPLWYGNNYGWAHSDWVSIGGSAPSTSPGATGAAYVIDGALNLRSGPSTSYSVISLMPNGTEVSLTGETAGGFSGVVYNGTGGWAFADYLSTSGPSAPDAEPTTPAPAPDPEPSNPGGSQIGDTVVGTMTTTASLNMRTGPGSGNGVITTIPIGSSVEVMGSMENGWYPVRYAGTTGWSHGDWLSSGSPSAPAPTPDPEPSNPGDTVVGTMRTTTRLNMRSGPGTGYGIITTLVNGATVQIMGDTQNGFYPVRYGSNNGWMASDWLSAAGAGVPGPPSEAPAPNPNAPGGVVIGDTVVGTMSTTIGLNLRQGPGANYNVVLVMPGGVSIDVMGDPVNGFYPLTFHGTKGWASGDYLRMGGATAPNPGNGAYTRDEIIQIIYAAADRYGQPRADMLRVAQCESVLDPYVVNPASGVSGLFQFMPGTWATTPYANQDIFDPVANANAAGWMWQNGRRNEWHCQ